MPQPGQLQLARGPAVAAGAGPAGPGQPVRTRRAGWQHTGLPARPQPGLTAGRNNWREAQALAMKPCLGVPSVQAKKRTTASRCGPPSTLARRQD